LHGGVNKVILFVDVQWIDKYALKVKKKLKIGSGALGFFPWFFGNCQGN
jgi:hypothetical protein